MSTPNGTMILATDQWTGEVTGYSEDITEGVQCLYDLLLGSMDFGSGFLSIEELEPILKIAKVCGFDTAALDDYMAHEREMLDVQRKRMEKRERQKQENLASGMNPLLGLKCAYCERPLSNGVHVFCKRAAGGDWAVG